MDLKNLCDMQSLLTQRCPYTIIQPLARQPVEIMAGYAERDIFDFFNPLSIAEQNKNDGTDTRSLLNFKGEYDFSDLVDGLKFSFSYSLQRELDWRGHYYAKTAKFRGSNRDGLGWNQK